MTKTTTTNVERHHLIYVTDQNRHLVCLPYSTENLHAMAKELDIHPCWFHETHYDIPKRRIEEIAGKCYSVSSKTIVAIIKGDIC